MLATSRSRTSRGRHYLPRRSRVYRELVQASWMAAGRPYMGAVPFTLSARFYGARANADLDNLCKAILDALNCLAYDDDRQLVCIAGAQKRPVDERGPRAEPGEAGENRQRQRAGRQGLGRAEERGGEAEIGGGRDEPPGREQSEIDRHSRAPAAQK